MKRTMDQLWKGHIMPGPDCGVGDPETERLHFILEEKHAALSQKLNDHQRGLFDAYTNQAQEFANLLSAHAFCDGFSLASRLLAEAFLEDV